MKLTNGLCLCILVLLFTNCSKKTYITPVKFEYLSSGVKINKAGEKVELSNENHPTNETYYILTRK